MHSLFIINILKYCSCRFILKMTFSSFNLHLFLNYKIFIQYLCKTFENLSLMIKKKDINIEGIIILILP